LHFLCQAFKPTSNDLKEYAKVLDANGDGAVSLQDLEALSVQYLCGEGVLANTGSLAGNRFDSSQFSASSYQNVQKNDITSTNLNQKAQRSSKYDTQG
jgi:hypothetical protein